MPRCLFCLQNREWEELTDEHIFLAALGGDLVLEHAVCATCNNGFSKAFEQAVAAHFADFRFILLIPDRYGNVPERRVKVEIDGELLDAKVLPDRTIQLKPVVTCVKKAGVIEVVYRHATEKQIEDAQQKSHKEGVELILDKMPEQEGEVNMSGDLRFIDSPEVLRTVTKAAYTTLALRMGREFAMRDIFASTRDYIRTGNVDPKARLFLHEEYMEACQQGPHQHSVILAARNNRRSVDAIVRLFGGLSYLVNLSDSYDGPDFFNTLVYHSQKGEECPVLFANAQAELLQVEEVSSSEATVWNDRARSGQWFLRFLSAEMNAELIE